jgi:putative hydrolase of the HAD superfamily
VAEKTAARYRQTVQTLGAEEAATWMIGNSPRSDINPAIAAGINAVFIPHPHTWVLEHDEIVLEGARQFLQLEQFEHLRRHF